MTAKLSKINFGMIDGKFEYVKPRNQHDERFYDAYLIPDNVDVSDLKNSQRYFVEGFRGTGKTSLLRWISEQKRRAGYITEFVLFKSDLPEEKRENLSSQVGITWLETERDKMEFSQDFKASWTWFIYHKIGEAIERHPTASTSTPCSDFLKLLGLKSSAFKKVMGFLPKLEKLNVEISADFEFFSTKLGGEFISREDGKKYSTLTALNAALDKELRKFQKDINVVIFFDELEVFYDEKSKYERDQRMVRDLLFSVSNINEILAEFDSEIHILAAVRSEVLDGFGALGQEVDRVVHDRGVKLAWHFSRRDLGHPLFSMIAKKIRHSNGGMTSLSDENIIKSLFPLNVRGIALPRYLLDRSFYKPRDLIWRLTIVQKQFSNEEKITDKMLIDTEGDYSSVMWDEIRYELSANYSAQEINVIEMCMSGFRTEFTLPELEERMETLAKSSKHTREFLTKHGLLDVLNDLYRLGAVGNAFREGPRSSDVRNRWAFRGDPSLLPDKKIAVNSSLAKRLSLVAPHQRGEQRRKKRMGAPSEVWSPETNSGT